MGEICTLNAGAKQNPLPLRWRPFLQAIKTRRPTESPERSLHTTFTEHLTRLGQPKFPASTITLPKEVIDQGIL